MKKLLFLFLMTVMTLAMAAQPPQKGGRQFDPERFMRDQEAFITKKASLSQQEAAAFFPLFREMQGKERELFMKMRKMFHGFPQDDAQAEKLIKERDAMDLQIKKIEGQYHAKFLKVLSARKVLLCIKAEEDFKRMAMDRMAKKMSQRPKDAKKKN